MSDLNLGIQHISGKYGISFPVTSHSEMQLYALTQCHIIFVPVFTDLLLLSDISILASTVIENIVDQADRTIRNDLVI